MMPVPPQIFKDQWSVLTQNGINNCNEMNPTLKSEDDFIYLKKIRQRNTKTWSEALWWTAAEQTHLTLGVVMFFNTVSFF